MASQRDQQQHQEELKQLLQPMSFGQPSQSSQPSRLARSVESSPIVSPKQRGSGGGDVSPGNPYKKQPLSFEDGDLPTNVSTEAQLDNLPDVCLSGIKNRPLRHVNERGDVSTYALQPMFFSVIFILLVELLERFSFYGVNYTQTSFLTGEYNPDWNAGMTSIAASSYVSISVAVAYSMPFLGALLADCVFGDYWSILFGSIFFYLPGLLLILLSSVPYLLGETFNKMALSFGLLFLWPMGTGIVKSIVNVFGAKQVSYIPLHSIQQTDIQRVHVHVISQHQNEIERKVLTIISFPNPIVSSSLAILADRILLCQFLHVHQHWCFGWRCNCPVGGPARCHIGLLLSGCDVMHRNHVVFDGDTTIC
jgi:hypothetical protein